MHISSMTALGPSEAGTSAASRTLHASLGRGSPVAQSRAGSMPTRWKRASWSSSPSRVGFVRNPRRRALQERRRDGDEIVRSPAAGDRDPIEQGPCLPTHHRDA